MLTRWIVLFALLLGVGACQPDMDPFPFPTNASVQEFVVDGGFVACPTQPAIVVLIVKDGIRYVLASAMVGDTGRFVAARYHEERLVYRWSGTYRSVGADAENLTITGQGTDSDVLDVCLALALGSSI